MIGAVQMGLKLYAIGFNLAQFTETEYLEATAVGQYRTIPGHKFMQTTHGGNQIITGTQIQMVRVAQENPYVIFPEILRRQRFHRSLRTYRHKNGCFYCTMRRFQFPGPRFALRIRLNQSESQITIIPFGIKFKVTELRIVEQAGKNRHRVGMLKCQFFSSSVVL
jgi:hypothetical protein